MKVSVSEFKATCTRLLREVHQQRIEVEVTNHGRTVAVVRPPEVRESAINPLWGVLPETETPTERAVESEGTSEAEEEWAAW